MDEVSAGTKCFTCYLGGHYCPAKALVDDIALCLACKENRMCSQFLAVQRMLSNRDSFWEKIYALGS